MTEQAPSTSSHNHTTDNDSGELSAWEKINVAKDAYDIFNNGGLSRWEKVHKIGNIGLNLANDYRETVTNTPETDSSETTSSGEIPLAAPEALIDAIEDGLSTPETPRETDARATLATVGEIEQGAEKEATFRIKALNRLDRAQRTARLLTIRENKSRRRISNIERKLVTAKEGSRKQRRLENNLILREHQLKKRSGAQEKTFGRMYNRSDGFNKETRKTAEVERTRNLLVVKKQVALEERRRKKLEKKYKKELESPDQNRRQQLRKELFNNSKRRETLKKEITKWENTDIHAFTRPLLKAVNVKYRNRINELSNTAPANTNH